MIPADKVLLSRRRNKEHLLQQKHKYRKKSTARQYHPKQKKFLVRWSLAGKRLVAGLHLLHTVYCCLQEWAEANGKSCIVTSKVAFDYLCLFTRQVGAVI